MVKLELELTEIDYDLLIREYLPKAVDKLKQSGSPLAGLLGGGMAGSLLQMASNSMKDKLAAELINAGASQLEQELEKLAAKNGIPGRVKNLKATAIAD